MATLVSEKGALDAGLSISPVFGVSPNKDSVAGQCSEHNCFARSDELRFPSFFVFAGVVPLIERETGKVTIFCQPP
ncbi:hypothetical protein [Asticcacaulis excentricus]|uniref:hypothetical protein n=1 Tax=Asticcacaulis excentricus TaxID=78587 RepID=UPI000F81B202|nr:hypothetical protein [Asticcacaulis excentricus]